MPELTPSHFAKLMIAAGVTLSIMGGVLLMLSHLGLPKLPGDIHIQTKNFRFYFPLATCVVISLILTLVLYLVRHFNR